MVNLLAQVDFLTTELKLATQQLRDCQMSLKDSEDDKQRMEESRLMSRKELGFNMLLAMFKVGKREQVRSQLNQGMDSHCKTSIC